jgi:hypothetical protein
VRIASTFPNYPFFLHQKPIHFPRRYPKVDRRSHTMVHLELGEEEPGLGSWNSSQLWLVKGIIIELSIKEVLFLSQIMVY